MCSPPTRLAILLGVTLLTPGLAAAQKPDKDDKKFLDDVRPILLQDEEKTFKALKEKADRLEFRKIFWARRDPDLATPENEFQAEYQEAKATADVKYRVSAQLGSGTDCGRTYILLGKPDDVQEEGTGSPGLLAPQTWTYRDRPGRTFQGGKAVVAFDADCRAPGGFSTQLDRIAASKVIHPNIDYRKNKDGRLVKLVDLLPRDTAARALFKQPRQDFAVAIQPGYLKVADGSTALVGLLQGDASALAVADSGGAKTVNVSVAASVGSADGKEVGWTEQTTNAPVGADGKFLASFKLALKPGKYTLRAGAVEVKGTKASLASIPIEVPDFSQVETAADGSSQPLVTGTILVIRKIEDLSPDSAEYAADPFAAFHLANARLIPVFTSELRRTDTVSFFFQLYDFQVDPATGKANGTARLRLMKEGKGQISSSGESAVDTPVFGSEIGPIPIEKLEPGKYTARLEVTDKLTKRSITQDAAFEVLP
jgi:GWxTD domain-containing protein